jgi:hypothetical protein
MKRSAWGIAVAMLIALSVVWSPPRVLAEDSALPSLGPTILEEDLLAPNLFQPFACRTGHGGWDYVDEGMRVSLTGTCSEGDRFAAIAMLLRGLTMTDGEVSIQAKVLSGSERMRFGINTRAQPAAPGAPRAGHAVGIEPGAGRGLLGATTSAVTQVDLGGIVSDGDWNTLAIRLQGPSLWLLVNDQPAAFVSDSSVDRGDVLLNLVRLNSAADGIENDPNDSTEVAVVFRNVRVSGLADGEPARLPTYQRP